MAQESRLAGIDLFRGIAIFSVVVLHADQGMTILPVDWVNIIEFASFAVPFFLAVSFYLAVQKLYSGKPHNLKARIFRLLIPYTFWSLVYLFYKSIKCFLVGDFNRFNTLFQDPVALVFSGGSSFHLYFLPLLLTGTLLIKMLDNFSQFKQRFKLITIAFIITLIIYEVLLSSSSEFKPGLNIAFQPLLSSMFMEGHSNSGLRLLLIELSWILRCLPYIFCAMLLAHPSLHRSLLRLLQKSISAIILLISFLIVDLFGHLFLFSSLHEISQGYLALLLAIALSCRLKGNNLTKSLSTCSFGIYLAHVISIEILQSVEKRIFANSIFRTSTLNLLIFAVLIFLITWIAVWLLTKQRRFSKVMFGN